MFRGIRYIDISFLGMWFKKIKYFLRIVLCTKYYRKYTILWIFYIFFFFSSSVLRILCRTLHVKIFYKFTRKLTVYLWTMTYSATISEPPHCIKPITSSHKAKRTFVILDLRYCAHVAYNNFINWNTVCNTKIGVKMSCQHNWHFDLQEETYEGQHFQCKWLNDNVFNRFHCLFHWKCKFETDNEDIATIAIIVKWLTNEYYLFTSIAYSTQWEIQLGLCCNRFALLP